ncbi:MAG: hypothetical protein QNJ30_23080 [Kiloniellales bacterium]|nr:hypothetical protein [Kiloniellales bacterium]
MESADGGLLQTFMGLGQGIFIWWVVAGLAGAAFAFVKKRNFIVWGIGCFLLPILVLVILVIPRSARAG